MMFILAIYYKTSLKNASLTPSHHDHPISPTYPDESEVGREGCSLLMHSKAFGEFILFQKNG